MLLGFQNLLDNPNPSDAVQLDASELYENDREAYRTNIKSQTIENLPDGL